MEMINSLQKNNIETMTNLSEKIQSLIDPKDPNQKLIGMLCLLIEDKFDSIDSKIETLNTYIENQKLVSDKHLVVCPRGMEERVTNIENDIDWIRPIKKYKYLLLIIIAGIVKLVEIGYQKIITLL